MTKVYWYQVKRRNISSCHEPARALNSGLGSRIPEAMAPAGFRCRPHRGGYVAPFDDNRRARLNIISYLLIKILRRRGG
jgi:hypothetical protein